MSSITGRKSFVATSLLTLVLFVVYGFYFYQRLYNSSLHQIDRKLSAAVEALEAILPPNFHDQEFTAVSVPYDQYLEMAKKLTRFAEIADLEFVYSMVMDEGAIRFVSSSLTSEKLHAGDIEQFYWVDYKEAPKQLRPLFQQEGKVFLEYNDRWGQFRSIFVSKRNRAGNLFVIGADVSMASLAEIKRSAIANFLVNSFFVLLLILIWAYTLRQDNRALTVANRRERLALSAGSIAIWEWQIDKEDLFVSPSLFLSLGYKPKDVPRTSAEIIAMIDYRDQAAFRERIKSVKNLASFENYKDEFQFRIMAPGDNVIWLMSKGELVKWSRAGRPALMAGILENITKYKNYEMALVETADESSRNSRFVRDLIDSLPDLVSYKCETGEYVLCSKELMRFFGKSESEILNQTDHDLLPQHIAELYRKNDLEALKSGEAIEVREWVTDESTGISRLIDTKKQRILSPVDGSQGVLSIGRDVTEYYKLVNDLEKYKRFIDNSIQGLIIISFDLQVRFLNRKMKSLLGIEHDVVANETTLSELNAYEKSFIKMLQNSIVPTIKSGKNWVGEVNLNSHVALPGELVQTIHSVFAMLNDGGVVLNIGMIVTDITEQKKIEAELVEQKQIADKASLSKSMFLANMSHEIRTPLNAVIGFSQVLQSFKGLDTAALNYISKIYTAGNRLLTLINEILDLSKIESGKMHLKLEGVNLAAELEGIIAIFQPEADTKGLLLKFENQLPEQTIVQLDKQKFDQIMINLLSNALKFTDEGRVTLHASLQTEVIIIRVSDTGRGMGAHELNRLFMPFEQGEAGIASGGGTGLGLALCHRLVELLDGEIHVESKQGAGSEFTVCLPHVPGAIEAQTLNASELSNAVFYINGNATVLIVDDDADSLEVLRALLESIGITSVSCANGREALAELQDDKYDCVLTDVRMPEMSGTALLAAIESQALAKHVIAVSASSLMHQRQHYLDCGFDGFVSKPVEYHDLVTNLVAIGKIQLAHTDAPPGSQVQDCANWQDAAITGADKNLFEHIKESLKQGDFDQAELLLARLSIGAKQQGFYPAIVAQVKKYKAKYAIELINTLLQSASVIGSVSPPAE